MPSLLYYIEYQEDSKLWKVKSRKFDNVTVVDADKDTALKRFSQIENHLLFETSVNYLMCPICGKPLPYTVTPESTSELECNHCGLYYETFDGTNSRIDLKYFAHIHVDISKDDNYYSAILTNIDYYKKYWYDPANSIEKYIR